MGMYHRESGFGGEAVELGKLPIKHAANYGQDGVQQS